MKYFIIFFLVIISACKSKPNEIKIKNQENVTMYNLLDYTEDFSDQTWQITKAVVKENVTNSPLIRKSADLLDLSKDIHQARLAQVIPGLEAGVYAFSIYLKALPGKSGKHAIAIYSKGAKNSFKSSTVFLSDNKWIRAVVKISQDNFGDIIVYPGNKQIATSQLDKLYIWGAQLEKIETLNEIIKEYSGKSIIE